MSCQQASSRDALNFSAGTLVKEYEVSQAVTRSKYDGKEISVSGNAVNTPMISVEFADQGSLLVEETESRPQRRVSCWFSKSQLEQFSKVRPGQFITVKGVFNGEAGVELKFCKLIKIE